MPVADYMRVCLTHPEHGYYVKRDPLGAATPVAAKSHRKGEP